MNCQLCQDELDAFLGGKLPEGTGIQVKDHLKNCSNCSESLHLLKLANQVMAAEREVQSNPFLVTRIMTCIEEMELQKENCQQVPGYQKILRPFLVSISLAAAIFAGVLIGSTYLSIDSDRKIPVELSYLDDATLESVELFSQL